MYANGYTLDQRFALARLDYVIKLRQFAPINDRPDYSRLIDLAIVSLYGDCQTLGVGSDARYLIDTVRFHTPVVNE